jgi:hypothetical protein
MSHVTALQTFDLRSTSTQTFFPDVVDDASNISSFRACFAPHPFQPLRVLRAGGTWWMPRVGRPLRTRWRRPHLSRPSTAALSTLVSGPAGRGSLRWAERSWGWRWRGTCPGAPTPSKHSTSGAVADLYPPSHATARTHKHALTRWLAFTHAYKHGPRLLVESAQVTFAHAPVQASTGRACADRDTAVKSVAARDPPSSPLIHNGPEFGPARHGSSDRVGCAQSAKLI